MMRLRKMVPSRRWLALPPLVIGILVLGSLANSKKGLERVETPNEPPVCEVTTVCRVEHQVSASGYGVARPMRRWVAVSEVSGRIVETHPQLRSGVAVAAGETLVLIDRSDYTLRLMQMQAEFDQAKAQLQELWVSKAADKASLTIQQELESVRKSDVDRVAQLRRSSTITEYEYETAKAAYLQQRQSVQTLVNSLEGFGAKIASAEAAITLAEARMSEAQRNVDRTRISAPFDGLLLGADLEQGQYVSAGQTLFEVIDTSSVEVEAQFSTAEITRVLWGGKTQSKPAPQSLRSTGATIASVNRDSAEPTLKQLTARIVTQTSGTARAYSARPLRMSSTIDERTRTIGIVVCVENRRVDDLVSWVHQPHLRVGTFCEVELSSSEPALGILLPRSAVSDGVVMLVDSENRLQRRPLEIQYLTGEFVAVASGLSEGERVAVNPPAAAIEGQIVRPIEVGEMQSAEAIPEDTSNAP